MNNLKQERRWCVWKREEREGHTTKVPYTDLTHHASVSQPDQWLTYDETTSLIEQNPDQFSGRGIFLSKLGEENEALCAIDIDAVKGEDGNKTENPLAREVVDLFAGAYVEHSPSGLGYHIFFKADLDKIPFIRDGRLISAFFQKNTAKELEVYIGGLTRRYMTCTENLVSETDNVTDQTDNLIAFLDHYMKNR